ISPLPLQRDEKTSRSTPSTSRTGETGKTFKNRYDDSREYQDPLLSGQKAASNETDTNKPVLSNDEWMKKRTIEELKTIVQAVQGGITDPWQLTDLIFYARHPEMKGVPLTNEYKDLLDEWNSISAFLVHPTINEIGDFLGANVLKGEIGSDKTKSGAQNFNVAFQKASNFRINSGSLNQYTTRFDDVIANAVEHCPGLSPAILKSLLAQESNFRPGVINSYGYAGIAQFGRVAAREVGLNVGIAGSASDERLDPSKAIPGAARLLSVKAQRLSEMAFSRYGQPNGIEFWKFVTAAYNGGEGTVALAMGNAYRTGMEQARAKGLVGTEAVSFARRHASVWDNLKIGGMNSPLGQAAARFFPKIAVEKYHEIGNYATQIISRAAV
ncbi:MAG: transglycosylase SLT domain-containing protein, partial [Pyrinomonadaceae bacterium]|nr:transglycosylase SLT domain-containing protein [Pyrinomonadaceae bacterium]